MCEAVSHDNLSKMSSENETEKLFDACWSGDLETVRRAIANGVNPNVANYSSDTPLHVACR